MDETETEEEQSWPELLENTVLEVGKTNTIFSWKKIPGHRRLDEMARRCKHTVAAYNDCLYIFGGDRGNIMLDDLLMYSIPEDSWVLPPSFSPPDPRYHHSAVVYKDSMFVFGGYTGDIHSNSNLTNRNDLYEYEFSNGRWRHCLVSGPAPVARSAHGAVVYDHQMWIFAGYDGNVRLNDMWAIPLNEGRPKVWTKIDQKGECPPTCCNFPVTVARDSMFLFSGQSGAKITNSLYQFRFKDCTWKRISMDRVIRKTAPPPTRRFGHSMVVFDRHLYVFGGAADGFLPNDLHSFDLDTQTWSIVRPSCNSNTPKGRLFHTATVVDDVMYVFGGTVDNNYRTGDLYQIQLVSYPKTTLNDDFGRLLDSKQFFDVDFLIGPNEHIVSAHVALVTARSKYLADEIKGQIKSKKPRYQVKLPETNPEAFKMVLTYMYTDCVDPMQMLEDPTQVVFVIMDVYKLASDLQMPTLAHLCFQYFENIISHDNALSALQYASSNNLIVMKDSCLRYITKDPNFGVIVMRKEFEKIEKNLMIKIIRRRQILQGCDAVERITEKNSGTTLEKDMESYLKHDGRPFCDVFLKLQNAIIPAHKAVLAARSSYFQALFRSFAPADNIIKMQIGDIIPSKQACLSLLKFIYYDDINMTPQVSLYLFSAPFFYGLTNNRLNAYCKENLEVNVSVEHVLSVLQTSDEIRSTDMKKHVLDLIVKNFPAVARMNEIRTISKELLLEIMLALADSMSDTTSEK